MVKRISFCAVILGLLCGLATLWMHLWKNESVPLAHPVIFTLDPGMNLLEAARKAETAGLTNSRLLLATTGRLAGHSSRLKAGEYAFKGSVSPREFFAKLVAGQSIHHAITLPDGGTFRLYKKLLRSAEKLQDDIAEMEVSTALEELRVGHGHAEGWFLPDTYHYRRGDRASTILKRAHDAMENRLVIIWNRRGPDLPYRSRQELLIAASIIEKESGLSSDRKRISGVISRRLQKRMRLQVDPTVIYGLGEAFDGDLTREHLRTRTPYNTYLYRGLPPTPIASPSVASIEAAAYPDRSDYLYFVARGDGSTEFSETLEEHRMAVRKYQLGRRD